MANEQDSEATTQSVANRVLAAFIAAVAEDGDIADIAPRLKPALLDIDAPREDAIRKALFGEGDA